MLLAWITVAHALTLPNTGLGTVHGWTADGALVLEVLAHNTYMRPDPEHDWDEEEGRLRYAVVVQGDKEIQRWLIAKELPAFAKVEAPLQVNEWTAWRNAHPLAPATSGRSASNGVRIEARHKHDPPTWEGSFFRSNMNEDEPFVTVGLSNAGEGFWSVYRQPLAQTGWSTSRNTDIAAYWSSDGRQVAFIGHGEDSQTMRGIAYGALDIVLSRASPLVGVLAPSAVSGAVTDKVVAAISGLGLVQKGEAKAARDASVVYFAPGYEADAKAIAAKVPGGATTAPMDWKAAQHIVVAVGASAR